MLEKPQMEREVAVVVSHECVRAIYLYSTLDALPDLREFGLIAPYDGVPDKYVLWVDGRC